MAAGSSGWHDTGRTCRATEPPISRCWRCSEVACRLSRRSQHSRALAVVVRRSIRSYDAVQFHPRPLEMIDVCLQLSHAFEVDGLQVVPDALDLVDFRL